MDRAQQSLGQKNLDNAGNEEKNALEALRQGADALAKEAQEPEAASRSRRATPIPWAVPGVGTGDSTKIPEASPIWRGRARILQELRRRAGERGRPQQELDYYDRLLKEF